MRSLSRFLSMVVQSASSSCIRQIDVIRTAFTFYVLVTIGHQMPIGHRSNRDPIENLDDEGNLKLVDCFKYLGA